MPTARVPYAGFQIFTFLLCLWAISKTANSADPLSSWKDGDSKQQLVAFVDRVTDRNSDGFVPAAERVAVFDNDGTLWCENPVPFQLAYALDVLKEMVSRDPDLKNDPAVAATMSGDFKALMADDHAGLKQIMKLTHSGMTTDEFDASVREWIDSAKHPRFQKRYKDCVYQPMIEVLDYLRANGFKTFIVSGGGQDFMRVWSEEVYGIPPEQVIGSSARTKYELRGDKTVLIRTLEDLFIDDKQGKPVGIHQFIGRRPILCFGNSDGDQAMLEYTTIGNPQPSLGVIIHHTDAEREYQYDTNPKSSGKLETAWQAAPSRGWILVDMKQEWEVVFPE